jgi:Helicase associated domain
MEDSRVRLSGEEEEGDRGASTQSNLALNEEKWEAMLGRLRAFKLQFGHTQIPYRYPADPQLGRWGKSCGLSCPWDRIKEPYTPIRLTLGLYVVSVQRSLYKRIEDGTGKSNTTLTSERIQKLNDIDFEWVARDHRTVPWEARYQELVAFVRRYGHSQVPIGWEVRTTSDPKLMPSDPESFRSPISPALGLTYHCRTMYNWRRGSRLRSVSFNRPTQMRRL